jgi:hypothetical protein
MKMKVSFVLARLAVSGTVQAQQLTGGVTLSYGMLGGGRAQPDLTARGLDGRVDIDFENGFRFGMQAGLIDVDEMGHRST